MQRLALCIGINDYPGEGADLSGCVNDALDWSQLLQSRGYYITMLLDAQATKQAVVTELSRIVDSLKYRDRFVFTFSGHGTWVPDQDGDEIDGRDEALCCHDYSTGGLLTDDEMHNIFKRARYGTQVTILSDSCHSGTVARELPLAAVPAVPKPKPRFMSPAAIPVVPVTVDEAVRAERLFTNTASRTGPVLISGCNDPEYSYDASFENRPNGAFTRAAIDAFRKEPEPKTIREWYRRIREMLPTATYPQSPQLGATFYQSLRGPLA